MDEAEVNAVIDRISQLCESIVSGAQECANPDHLIRIVGTLECVFMAGHDDIDYEEEAGDRRPDA
ncbi:MAG TPA: hypothetical protein VFB34_07230 [Chloroflexota bacterium]|nr:hypothetical protein [Chloroflexota bacterium]